MCVAHTVMNRNRGTDDAFGDKKFQQQNLNHINEAVRDVSVRGILACGCAGIQSKHPLSLRCTTCCPL